MPRTGRPPIERVTVRCAAPDCGKSMQRRRTDVERNTSGRFFCDAVCLAKVGAKPRKGEERTCALGRCTVTFYASTNSTRLYCSPGCRDEANQNRRARVCQGCGVTFELAESEPDVYCSRDCYLTARLAASIGKRIRTQDGYIRVNVADHPRKDANGTVAEHRLVMEGMIGRYLIDGENVHHRNGVRDDNRPENLELWVSSQPSGQRVEDIVAHAHLMLARYGSESERAVYG